MLVFKLHGIVWELSMVRTSYKLTKRTTQAEKIEKSWKILKVYYIRNFEIALYKLTALGNIIHPNIIYKLMRLISILGQVKNKKRSETANSKKGDLLLRD